MDRVADALVGCGGGVEPLALELVGSEDAGGGRGGPDLGCGHREGDRGLEAALEPAPGDTRGVEVVADVAPGQRDGVTGRAVVVVGLWVLDRGLRDAGATRHGVTACE